MIKERCAAWPPNTIAVVCLQRIGDVLLSTALVRSIKRQWPDAQVDMIVFRGTESALEHNPDIRRVTVVERRASWRSRIGDAARIWRRYDLACVLQASTRGRFYAWAAARYRIGVLDPDCPQRASRVMIDRLVPDEHRRVHTLTSNLALTQVMGIPPVADVVPPGIGEEPARRAALDARLAAAQAPFAVIHPSPMFAYKQWRLDGWVETVRRLRDAGFAVVLTGGPAPAEAEYAEQVVAHASAPVLNLVGQLSLGETAEVIRRAALFVGPDTGVTHIAAACGTPTVAIFGPSNPMRWGPWPSAWPAGREPWPLRGSARRGNVFLLQGEGDCVPCKAEGCERHVTSTSRCLTELDARRVLAAVADVLDRPDLVPAGVTQPVVGPGPDIVRGTPAFSGGRRGASPTPA
ncbi:glycosyltransferase family 9 protein [Trinickia caryophylli]|uniref:Heptosyltransferase-3 n=1 Tax=Trinickia caryophylli TaxID=28094 RepID=A0A1X7GTF3_TRICW|nr:glycosyltransferase family 9 protein [Trinickia caryophylli]PMS08923.1 glycosyltransferase family 9 protein [Trinickia caryophylli]TRX18131.1 glycosyltransferase family 9 protein [Trinickia caryophylli]WQE11085.1 glycosyltransferase family 9 protein [Trinickia caryophylli]SMF74500.1 heptosyltransferase-3 [Trinickia caryophylli]GLU35241.1 LPS core biosynthesis protein [Trinickia caryophylli]